MPKVGRRREPPRKPPRTAVASVRIAAPRAPIHDLNVIGVAVAEREIREGQDGHHSPVNTVQSIVVMARGDYRKAHRHPSSTGHGQGRGRTSGCPDRALTPCDAGAARLQRHPYGRGGGRVLIDPCFCVREGTVNSRTDLRRRSIELAARLYFKRELVGARRVRHRALGGTSAISDA